jgi:hypothetical protein
VGRVGQTAWKKHIIELPFDLVGLFASIDPP